jgi:hypothetical protein
VLLGYLPGRNEEETNNSDIKIVDARPRFDLAPPEMKSYS